MARPSASATRSWSPERGLTRRPCRGLLEAALARRGLPSDQTPAIFPFSPPIQSTSATRTATAATTRRYAWRTSCRRENAGRASCEAATGLPGPQIDVTNSPAQRRSHSGTLVGISAPRGAALPLETNTRPPLQLNIVKAAYPHRRRPRSTYRQLSTHARHGQPGWRTTSRP